MTKPPTQSADRPAPKVSAAWPAFAEKLCGVLGKLGEDQYLIVSAKQSNRFVQFAGGGSAGMRVEAVSNAYLPASEQIDEARIARLGELGWQAPTGTAASSTPEDDPDGSPNFFIEFARPVPFAALAELAVRTMVEVLRIAHPNFLEYQALDAGGNGLAYPELGLKRATRTAAEQRADLAERLLATLKEATGVGNLETDGDGDIEVRYGSVVAFVRLVDDPPAVRIRAVLVVDVEATPALLARLNELNTAVAHLHFVAYRRAIGAVTEVHAAPFVPEHVARALYAFCELCDGIDELLRSEFGGRTIVAEAMPSTMKH